MPSSPSSPRIRRGWIAAGLLLAIALAVALSLPDERAAVPRAAPQADVSGARREVEQLRAVLELEVIRAEAAVREARLKADLRDRWGSSCALAADGTPIPCR